MAQPYLPEESPLSPKCQCVTFEKSGKILGSDDSLFPVTGMTRETIERYFPFLKTVASSLESSDPLFYPGLDFRFREYHSICDFTFMKTTDDRGRERFIWIIYDNSTHYSFLINNNVAGRNGKAGAHQAVTSTTFLKAG